eukprot:100156_1
MEAVELLIKQFNEFTLFIQIQILREKTLKHRTKAIKRMIKMGEQFKVTRNYYSLCAVFSALNSSAIHRLKYAWARVPQKTKQMFEGFRNIFRRDFNHKGYRQIIRKAAGNPCIPHIGLFLQDLSFVDDGLPQKSFEMMYEKCVRKADRIQTFLDFQRYKYSTIIENKKVQKVLLMEFDKLKDITEDQIYDMSTEIKKQDEKSAKRGFLK